MVFASDHADELAPGGDAVLLSPTLPTETLRGLADRVATATGHTPARVHRIPSWPLAAAGVASPTFRSLHQQRYLWYSPCVVEAGVLTSRHGLQPSTWDDVSFD